MSVYLTLEDFYANRPERRNREEADYGVHWRLEGWPHKWRVSYVRNTGEIYAVHQQLQGINDSERPSSYGPLFVVGQVPPDPVPEGNLRQLFYQTLEDILDGWPAHC